jgi:GAF domain-containing protein
MKNTNRDLKKEIAERKRAEERIQHLNTLLRAVRNISQLIAKEKDRDCLLQGACASLTEAQGYHSTWIVFLDESRRLAAAAQAGLGEDFQPLVDRAKRSEWSHCANKALSQAGVSVIDDPVSACGDCPIAKRCLGRKTMAARLEYAGGVFGLISAAVDGDRTIDEEEQSLFEEVAGDVAFALNSIRLEEERQRTEAALLLEPRARSVTLPL